MWFVLQIASCAWAGVLLQIFMLEAQSLWQHAFLIWIAVAVLFLEVVFYILRCIFIVTCALIICWRFVCVGYDHEGGSLAKTLNDLPVP